VSPPNLCLTQMPPRRTGPEADNGVHAPGAASVNSSRLSEDESSPRVGRRPYSRATRPGQSYHSFALGRGRRLGAVGAMKLRLSACTPSTPNPSTSTSGSHNDSLTPRTMGKHEAGPHPPRVRHARPGATHRGRQWTGTWNPKHRPRSRRPWAMRHPSSPRRRAANLLDDIALPWAANRAVDS